MPIPLFGASTAVKSTYNSEMVEARRKAANINAALSAFDNNGPVEQTRTKSSNGIGQLMAWAYPNHPPAPVRVRKALDTGPLHPRAKAATYLPENALRLFDLICKADDANKHAYLISVDAFEVAKALDITVEEATAARKGLENIGLIRFYNNHSGDAGWRPVAA